MVHSHCRIKTLKKNFAFQSLSALPFTLKGLEGWELIITGLRVLTGHMATCGFRELDVNRIESQQFKV